MAIKTQQGPKTLKLCYRAFGTAGFAGFVLCLAILAHAQERDSPWQTEPYKTWEGWITTMGPMTHVVVNPDALHQRPISTLSGGRCSASIS